MEKKKIKNLIKLSPAQLRVLFELKKGTRLHLVEGRDTYWFLSKGLKKVNFTTVLKLEKFNFITITFGFHKEAFLTDKGRTYLDILSKGPKG
jgi:hypothetical protein